MLVVKRRRRNTSPAFLTPLVPIQMSAALTELVGFDPFDNTRWGLGPYLAWVAVVQVGLELLTLLAKVPALFPAVKRIPESGKALETLSPLDWAFIAFNRLSIAVFAYHSGRWMLREPRVKWAWAEADLWNAVLSVPALFIVYDFFYSLWHWFLHIREVYPWIHRHHHRQVVPFRGGLDAVNVHPVEFVAGDYCHLLAAWIVCRLLPTGLHAATFVAFVGVGGLLAYLNHTRFDLGLGDVYEVSYHDVHHHLFRYNYGQYTMFWDRIWGTYRPHSKDAVKDS
ncbi:putative C-5 sterol desaturase [Hyaloraphidium curvatum]|nr:putative C-5 sterol desaturase [Hyaloraphidium curvatum]